MDFLDVILKYWVQWLCGIVAGGVVAFARRYVKMEKKALEDKWKERESQAKDEVIQKLEAELQTEIRKSEAEDRKINADIEALSLAVENLNAGILSIQGKQFRDNCLRLLEKDHVITIPEYEQFEEDYAAYKALGGNHRGDALHERVVEKFDKQQ